MQKRFASAPELFVMSSEMEHKALKGLDGAEEVLDWGALEEIMSGIYAKKVGRPSYPLLTLFRGLLLGMWYGMSDRQLSDSLARDLLFGKFCRLDMRDGTPDATTLGRFRQQLVEHDVWEVLLGEVNRQLEEQRIIMTEGRINIIDATPVEAAQIRHNKQDPEKETKDPEAGWHVKENSRGKKTSTYGYSVHTGVDEDGFVHRQSVTPGNVHDSQERDTLLLGDETQLYADAGYASQETDQKLEAYNIDNQVQAKAQRNKPLSEADKERNRVIAVTRSGGERPFATYKQHYKLRRTRLMGLAKNTTHFGIAAIALNVRKAAQFLADFGHNPPLPA